MTTNEAPVYIILGASGGIGSAVSRKLASTGAHLLLGARQPAPLQALASEIGGVAHTLDATQFDAVQGIVKQAIDQYGRLDGIANCVGSILLKPAHLTSVEEFAETINQNLNTAFYTVKAGARAMMKHGGSIVLCSSAVARKGLVNHEAIAAAKAGIVGLAQSAAATYAPRNIRINCVAPGLVETPLSARITSSEAGRTQSEKMHALGRLGQPDDIAEGIIWLLDHTRSSWVTGQVIGIDGGLGTLFPRP
ncbi:MAG: SDR family oxidoreductase [Bacteroidota bacterium]